MNLNALKTKLNHVEKAISEIQLSRYTCRRDEEGNLIIDFAQGKSIKLPLLKLRPYQLEVQWKLFKEKVRRFFLVRPRRAGKEVEAWNMIIQGAIEDPGLYLMIYPTNVRARLVLWDGAITMPNGTSMRFLDMIPKELIRSKNETEMSIELINNSVIKCLGSTDANSLRGPNPRGAAICEYAWCDPEVRRVIMPAIKQNGGWLLLQSTYYGRNHAYKLMERVKDNDRWYCREDSVESLRDENGNRYITDAMIQEDREDGMSEAMIRQEYYSSIELDESTLYFAREVTLIEKTNRIIKGLSFPGRKAWACMDLGISDSTTVSIVQMDDNKKPVVVGYFESHNQPYNFYFREADKFCIQNGLILKGFIAPHDGANRDKGTGKDIRDYAAEAGYHCDVVSRPQNHLEAIQLIRLGLDKTRFNAENTERLIECLSNYSKIYDEKLGVYRDMPAHNWASHGVKSFQTMCLGIEKGLFNEENHEIVYYSN